MIAQILLYSLGDTWTQEAAGMTCHVNIVDALVGS